MNSFRLNRGRLCCVSALLGLGLFSVGSFAAGDGLITAVDDGAGVSWPRDEGAAGSWVIGLDSGLLGSLDVGDVVEFPMFDDAAMRGVVDLSDGKTLGGWLEDDDGRVVGGSFLFAVHDDAVAGIVRVPGVGGYRIRGTRDGVGLVELIADDSFGACDGGVAVADAPGHVGGGVLADDWRTDDVANDRDTPTVVDVLVVYTEEAKNSVGSTAQMLAQIDLAVAATNRAYANSLIGFDLNLVHAAEVDYDENTAEYGEHLRQLTNTDGVIDEIHELRETYGADMVSLMVNDRRSCGNAWTMHTNSVSFESNAFSVTTWTCAVGNMSFAHELGHNMGACHAPSDPCSGGVFNYSTGHRFVGDSGSSWRSVMAYSPGSRVEYFSNPDIVFDGQATGILDVSQNALTLNLTGATVANFRAAVPVCVADFTGDGSLNFFDVSFFLAYYANEDPQADINGDEKWNFYDVSAFLVNFMQGCP